MKNNEHLALFVLGIGTLGITFLLLFAMNDRNVVTSPAVDRQVSVSVAQADVTPQAPVQPPAQINMEVLDRQVAETFASAGAYLGRGKYEEKEHISLLERLEFYGGMSSIRPEQKQTAQDLIKDMGRLLTLKESIARQVRLAGQINAVESDVQIHLAKGDNNEAAAQKLIDRIETMYAIQGLTEDQNRQLRTSLTALKNAYKAPERTVARASTPPQPAVTPKAVKPAAPAPAPAAIAKADPPVEAPKEAKPAPKAPATPPASQQIDDKQSRIVKEKYYKVMTLISSYFVERKYRRDYHDELSAQLSEVSKDKDALTSGQRERLNQTIAKMKRIDEKYRPQVSTVSSKN